MTVLLGCIADDFTGATDLANTLVKQGLKTVLLIGIPEPDTEVGNAEAIVVALKSRTIEPQTAVNWSLAALRWLKKLGTRQFFFKYCSTFDSTEQGNIGPVTDALMDELGCDFTIACPAFPDNGRTIYKGNLFVDDVLLSESGMRNHPLTPMHDSNLVRVLGKQVNGSVGLIDYDTVYQGPDAIEREYLQLKEQGTRYAIVDALSDVDLINIGKASKSLPLITGGSGIAMGLPDNFRALGLSRQATEVAAPNTPGRQAVLAGSCSISTRTQLAAVKEQWPTFDIDPYKIIEGGDVVSEVLKWALSQSENHPIVISSSSDPIVVESVQKESGRKNTADIIETSFGEIARGLVGHGFTRLVVAGGETSGSVVGALNINSLSVGPEIDPGVPWCETTSGNSIALALKSGNFGSARFFEKAFGMLQ